MWSMFNAVTALLVLLDLPKPPDVLMWKNNFNPLEIYDFVIIGAGSSGCVLARRLSERWKVLLLEAGSFNTGMRMRQQVPAFFWTLQGSSSDWNYRTTQQRYACRRTGGSCEYPLGKTLGGSSSINAMLYTRGYSFDYDRWYQKGAVNWNYQNLIQYFERSEKMLSIQHFNYVTPLADDYIKAAQEMSFLNTQCNETFNNCIYKTQNTVKNIFRHSAFSAYLENFSTDSLTIINNAFVYKLIISENKVNGVEFELDGNKFIVKTQKEIILSAGAIHSPKILMLSGIGPKDHLRKHNIKLVQELPVGENLQDHTRVALFYVLNSSFPTTLEDLVTEESIRLYTERSGGPMSSTGIEAMAFFKTNSSSIEPPDVQLCFSSFVPMPKSLKVIAVTVTGTRPESLGYVRLKNSDPKTPPIINPKYFTKAIDLEKTILGLKKAHEVINTQVMEKYKPIILPRMFCNESKEDFFRCLAEYHSLTNYHPAGTVKMGNSADKTAVVDENLKVKGVEGLRVADMSVAPNLPSANTNALALMIGEKASDIIMNHYDNET